MGQALTNAATVDSTGAASTVKITTDSAFHAYAGYSPTIPIFRGQLYGEPGHTQTASLGGLTPGQLYDLYLYGVDAHNAHLGAAGQLSNFHLTGLMDYGLKTLTGAQVVTFAEGVNYVRYSNVQATAGGTLSFTYVAPTGSTGYSALSGLQLVIQAPAGNAYDIWAAGLSDPAFDADPNKDGIDNGMAWILGASGAGNAAGNLLKLPAISHDLSGALVLTFDRLIASHPIAPLVAQYGGNLSGWADFAVPAGGGSSTDGNLTVNVAAGGGVTAEYDRITVTIPAIYMAAHPATFVRLKAVK